MPIRIVRHILLITLMLVVLTGQCARTQSPQLAKTIVAADVVAGVPADLATVHAAAVVRHENQHAQKAVERLVAGSHLAGYVVLMILALTVLLKTAKSAREHRRGHDTMYFIGYLLLVFAATVHMIALFDAIA